MVFSEIKNAYLFKIIPVLVIMIISLFSCKTLPDFPEVPKNYEQSQLANIKLITVNDDGFSKNFGGTHTEMTCIFPYWTKGGAITFDSKYIVYAEEEWESSNGKFLGKRYKFNDKATFGIPAGTYKVCLYRIFDYDSSTPSVMKNCYDKSPFQFDAGGNYEVYVYFQDRDPEDYTNKRYWKMAISEIRKVKEFKPTPLTFKE